MTNPLAGISDPTILRALVQDGVKCERCEGKGEYSHWWAMDELGTKDCESCATTGHAPLSNPDLDALAACWCEGWTRDDSQGIELWFDPDDEPIQKTGEGITCISAQCYPPAYTTSPDAAMRLAVKYQVGLDVQGYTHITAFVLETDINIKCDEDTVHSRCHAITTAALVAALTEAMEER